MVLFETGSNAILVKSLRDRTNGEMAVTYQSLIDRLAESKIRPNLHILDTDTLQEFKNAIKTNQKNFQLAPLNDHRRNIVKKAIQVFKDHLSQFFCGTDVSSQFTAQVKG